VVKLREGGHERGGALRVGVRAASLAIYLAGVLAPGGAVAATGDLTQKPGAAGCVSAVGLCLPGAALDGAASVTVSPDGASVYVASQTSAAVTIFDRAADGTLTQKPGAAGCISEAGTAPCAKGDGLDAAASVTVSPDGASVYVASPLSGAVAIFDRAADGTLTQKLAPSRCISESGTPPCTGGDGLDGAFSVTVSSDGASVYVASLESSAVTVFDRAADGTLMQKPGAAGCISQSGIAPCAKGDGLNGATSVTVSPDGANVYVASLDGDAVAIFNRAADGTLTQKLAPSRCISESGTAPCAKGDGLDQPLLVTVSPDGANVYVASANSSAVTIFDRAADGTLTQKPGAAGCISEAGSAPCTKGDGLDAAASVTVSPDGASVYVASAEGDAVAIFDRAADGALAQKLGEAACISQTGSAPCTKGDGLDSAYSVTVSPDGTSAYVASHVSDAVAIFDREPIPPSLLAPAPDTIKPRLSALKLLPRRFKAARKGATISAAPPGAKVTYKLSENAKVRFRIERALPGRRVGKRCQKPRRSNRHHKRCTRFSTLRGSFARQSKAGRNSFHFSGRLRGRKLAPGRYRLRAVATDAAGNASRPRRTGFRVKAGHR
jgi:DNA-binding beta-propeller fold protein YncE